MGRLPKHRKFSEPSASEAGRRFPNWQGPEFAKHKITHISLKAILTHLTHFTQSVHSPGHVRVALSVSNSTCKKE
jgi:hypothetical protein